MSGIGKSSFLMSNRVETGWGRIEVSGTTAGFCGPHKAIRTATLFNSAGAQSHQRDKKCMFKPLGDVALTSHSPESPPG